MIPHAHDVPILDALAARGIKLIVESKLIVDAPRGADLDADLRAALTREKPILLEAALRRDRLGIPFDRAVQLVLWADVYHANHPEPPNP